MFLCLRKVLEKDSSLNLASVVGVTEWLGTAEGELLCPALIAVRWGTDQSDSALSFEFGIYNKHTISP